MSLSRHRTAGAFALAAALWALAVPVVGASASPGYSHTAQYISELGATGARCGAFVSGASFAPTGALVIAVVLAAAKLLPRSRAVTAGLLGLAVVGAAYLITAIFRCDPGRRGRRLRLDRTRGRAAAPAPRQNVTRTIEIEPIGTSIESAGVSHAAPPPNKRGAVLCAG